jgi:hypothetical protein
MSDYLADVNPDNLANVVRALQQEVAALKLRDIHGIEKLNEVSDVLEPLTEFEFRSHLDPENPQEPGDGFSGVRICGEGMDYGGNIYAIACVLNDILQAGMNITLGRITAGGENVFLDDDGMSVIQGTAEGYPGQYAPNGITFLNPTSGSPTGDVYNYNNGVTGKNYTRVGVVDGASSLIAYSGATPVASIDASDDGAIYLNGTDITIGHDGNAILNALGVIYPGTWTPELTKTTNIAAATAYLSNYFRIGDKVHFDGVVAIDPTAAGAILLGISLPIASNFTTSLCLSGTAANVNSEVARLFADSTNKRMSLQGVVTGTTNIAWGFHGSYRIV